PGVRPPPAGARIADPGDVRALDALLVAGLCLEGSLVALTEPDGANERVHAGADGGIRNAELAFPLLEVAARAQEALEERELLPGQAAETADSELAFEGGAAAPAMDAADHELALADGAGGDDVVRHGGSVSSSGGSRGRRGDWSRG